MRIAICEDQVADRAQLREALERRLAPYGETLDVVEYVSAEALLDDMDEGEGRFALLFMDIVMAGMSGMAAARELRRRGCRVPLIFLTSSPDFALESYEVDAVGYLLKPLDETKLGRLLERVLMPPTRPRICVRSERRWRYLFLDEIMYAESEKHQTRLFLRSGETVASTDKLNDIEKTLADERFLRCHQSFLVNMAYVSDVVGDDFVLANGARVPMRSRNRRHLTESYYRYFIATSMADLREGETDV